MPLDADAEDRPATSTRWTVRAPATLELLAELDGTPLTELAERAQRGRRAARHWRTLAASERRRRLLAARDRLLAELDALASLVSQETGKPYHEAALHEVLALVDALTWQMGRAEELLQPRQLTPHLLPHRVSVLEREPVELVGVIAPSNFPLLIGLSEAFAAAAMGAAALVKPSEHTPLATRAALALLAQDELLGELLQPVFGGPELGEALIAQVDRLVFTGSAHHGAQVAACCARARVPCVLELSGCTPLLVTEGAELERTARAIVFGGFANAGQACISVERVFVPRRLHDELAQRVSRLAMSLRVGSGRGDFDVGALTTEETLLRVERHVADALAKEATLLCGGQRLPREGRFFAPTVLANCTLDMLVLQEETFGPVVPLMAVDSEEEAVEAANGLGRQLCAYVFGPSAAEPPLEARLAADTVVFDDVLSPYTTAEVPFGGGFGVGRLHGDDGLDFMTHHRHISRPRASSVLADRFWFPYHPAQLTLARGAARLAGLAGSLWEGLRGRR